VNFVSLVQFKNLLASSLSYIAPSRPTEWYEGLPFLHAVLGVMSEIDLKDKNNVLHICASGRYLYGLNQASHDQLKQQHMAIIQR